MRLTRLEAADFAMHAKLDLDLSGFDELVIVGENGHGKSRLLDAVLWCLYGRPARGSTDRMVRRGAVSMSVKTTWARDGHEYVVHRARSLATKVGTSSLTLTVDGREVSKHTIGETQADIERLWGPLSTLWAGPVMAQGESDALMRADPKDRKDVLGKLFGLDSFEKLHEAAKGTWERLVGEERVAQMRLTDAEATVVDTADVLAELDLARSEESETTSEWERVEAETAGLREYAVQLKERADRVQSLSADIARLNASIDLHTARRSELDAQLAEARNRANAPVLEPMGQPPSSDALLKARLEVAEERSLRSDRAVVAAKMHQLREALVKAEQQGLCDRCPYRTDVSEFPELERLAIAADGRLAELGDTQARLAGFEQAEREWSAFESSKQRREDAETMVYGLERMLDDLSQLQDRDSAQIVQANAERTRLMQDLLEVDGIAEQLQTKAIELQEARHAAQEAREVRIRLEARDGQRRAAEAAVVALEAQLAEMKTSIAGAHAVVRAFHRDGIPALVLEQGIPLIEARANAILDRMPGDLRLELVTQKETKAGTMRDTLEVLVETEGSVCDYELLSGAERFRVDFALRLGLADVLAHRAGTSFETLWLDEPFSAQSPRALETLLECLGAVAADFGLMVVVTHQPEVADRFPVRLTVTKDDGIATVEVAA